MKISDDIIEEVFEFKGLWDLPSKCGLQRIKKGSKQIVIVTELYQNNPGSSVTSVAASLAMQLAEVYHIFLDDLVYIEKNPDMQSKLSFYEEHYFQVLFSQKDGILLDPKWVVLSKDEFINLVK